MIPKEGMLKLTALRGEADDAKAAVANAHRRIGDINRLLIHEPEDKDALEAELARLEDVKARQDVKFKALANLVAALDDWLRRQPRDAQFEMARRITAKPHKGEAPADAVNRVRGEIETIVGQLKDARNALPPKADIKSSLAVKVRAMAANGAPSIQIMPDGVRLTFAEKTRFADTTSDTIGALLAWLDPERLIERLCAEIDKRPESALSLSTSAKAQRIADLSAQIEHLSRVEEALCEEFSLLRRPGAHAMAVLGLVVKERKAAA